MLHGDAVIDDTRGCCILGGDPLIEVRYGYNKLNHYFESFKLVGAILGLNLFCTMYIFWQWQHKRRVWGPRV